LGLTFIAVGTLVKTGFIQIRRGGSSDSTGVVVRTGAGDVEMPVARSDSAAVKAVTRPAPPTPRELVGDTLFAPAPANDTNAVRPTADELAMLAASLIVPVAGVQPKDLLDTFDERRGTPVLSAAGGRVLRVFSSQAGGLMVYASDPSDRFVLMYAHLDRYANGIADGMPLQRGDTIGFVGTTGNAPPNVPHLHFGIARTSNVSRWWTGMPIDPRPLLRR
jgi:hypothetical protein